MLCRSWAVSCPREAGRNWRPAASLPYQPGAGYRPQGGGWDWEPAASLPYRLGAVCPFYNWNPALFLPHSRFSRAQIRLEEWRFKAYRFGVSEAAADGPEWLAETIAAPM